MSTCHRPAQREEVVAPAVFAAAAWARAQRAAEVTQHQRDHVVIQARAAVGLVERGHRLGYLHKLRVLRGRAIAALTGVGVEVSPIAEEDLPPGALHLGAAQYTGHPAQLLAQVAAAEVLKSTTGSWCRDRGVVEGWCQ